MVLSKLQTVIYVRLYREKERARATRRSEQQERARKQAAASLMKKRGGWMAAFGTYMESAFSGVARTVDASMDEDISAPKVFFPTPAPVLSCSESYCSTAFVVNIPPS